MTLDEIKQLIALAQQTGVGELEVQRGENRVRVRLASFTVDYTAPAGIAPAKANAVHPDSGVLIAGPNAPAADPLSDPNVILVKSPIVGTFYESPSPGSEPFVKVGDTVKQGQVLCIIESMKLMNEIESEYSGTISARLVENGHAVEYGEALYAVRQS